MLERNNLDIARVIDQWVLKNFKQSRTAVIGELSLERRRGGAYKDDAKVVGNSARALAVSNKIKGGFT